VVGLAELSRAAAASRRVRPGKAWPTWHASALGVLRSQPRPNALVTTAGYSEVTVKKDGAG